MNPKWSKRFELKPGRWVYVPTPETLTLGREIKRAVERRWTPPPYYFHLRRGGHVQALRSHVANAVFLRLDIQDFFGSINRTRVTRSLASRFGYKQGREWANASTVVERETKRSILPFGFVQSPIIASLCLYDSALGRYLGRLKKGKKFGLSVYVDDIIVSCKKAQAGQLETEVLPALQQAAKRANFQFSSEKSEGPAPAIRAFNIDLSHASMRVQAERLAAFISAFENSESAFERAGIIGYVTSVNEEQASAISGSSGTGTASPEH